MPDELAHPHIVDMDILADGGVRLTFKDEDGNVVAPRLNLTEEVATQLSRLLNPDTRKEAVDEAKASLRRH